ncbi:hypothetical protein [Ornithinimicrobium sediminis]|uniref:hypothetical protein n=1 Tax=Ornithinimicrobium sediminis TaxID=2904603 RepID=UPI001E4E62DB|nr:hypothetical protein [Ornithinimicrobium sediminis]MCE0485355.1 hypothetical protein [Ornithinimicrobium sediminis]
MKHRKRAIAGLALASLLGATAAAAADPGVSPASVDEALDPGESITITKTVTTPEVPPKPDIVLLVDHTGSMGIAIDNVKANMADIITAVETAQPDAQFAVAIYCDIGEPVPPYEVIQDLTDDAATAVAAVDGITLCNGGDEPEAQLPALYALGDGGGEISYRADSSRVVAWFGDAPGHDPRLDITEADATQSLVDAGVKTLAISVGFDGLDATGQATRITAATGGSFFSGVGADAVADAILDGLTNLPVEVAGSPTCDEGLSVELDPASQVVTSGDDAVFEETVTVAADAPQGTTLTCEVDFTIDGQDAGPAFTQTISVDVNDVTPPTVSCEQGPNPAGMILPEESEAGFFRMVAEDNVDDSVEITVSDTGSDAEFGPYASGTTFKLTQAPGAKPRVTAFTGEVEWHFRLKGDAELSATDEAGNTGTALCEVPPHD